VNLLSSDRSIDRSSAYSFVLTVGYDCMSNLGQDTLVYMRLFALLNMDCFRLNDIFLLYNPSMRHEGVSSYGPHDMPCNNAARSHRLFRLFWTRR
jgi:hypothetical protein